MFAGGGVPARLSMQGACQLPSCHPHVPGCHMASKLHVVQVDDALCQLVLARRLHLQTPGPTPRGGRLARKLQVSPHFLLKQTLIMGIYTPTQNYFHLVGVSPTELVDKRPVQNVQRVNVSHTPPGWADKLNTSHGELCLQISNLIYPIFIALTNTSASTYNSMIRPYSLDEKPCFVNRKSATQERLRAPIYVA